MWSVKLDSEGCDSVKSHLDYDNAFLFFGTFDNLLVDLQCPILHP